MAEEFLTLEQNAQATKGEAELVMKNQKKWLTAKPFMIGAGVTSLLILAGLLAWLFIGTQADNTQGMIESNGQEKLVKEALYVAMPRPFLFNLPGHHRIALVEIKVQLMVRGDEHDLLVRKHIPLIEDALLTTFSSSDLQSLSTQSGKDEMRQLALRHLQNTLQPVTGQKVIDKLLFTGFIIQ
ncbi:flagellar basal body-associated FliL family protein [uncultured Shewanella sp.]|uniref:flagellar basal body-associated FliL family protein n=1 Tax=uncultured Shewanella sp. TaxID=173975 RepID=UPI0026246D37|nr:flagellar basal body-associated FliL family protein [uncultured Shewanella sp.]